MAVIEEHKGLPKFDCHLDESDPDTTVLRRQDGSFVVAFSARGSTRKGILEAAKEDYRGWSRRTWAPWHPKKTNDGGAFRTARDEATEATWAIG